MTAETATTGSEWHITDNSRQPATCPECGGSALHRDEGRGEVVCGGCGRVIEQELIHDDRRHAFSPDKEESLEQSGAPITYTRHDMGVSTEIGAGNELYLVPGKKRGQYYRLRKWHRRATENRSRNLGFALSELQRYIETLDLPDTVHEEVARLYEKAVENRLVKGRRIENILGALIYIIARNQGTPRTLDEIADVAAGDKQELGRSYRYVAREFNLKIRPPEPEAYLPKYASKLGVSGPTHATAHRIIGRARDNGLLAGRGPTGIAAAALYIATILEGDHHTQREIAETVGVTSVTIRNRVHEFLDGLDLDEAAEKLAH